MLVIDTHVHFYDPFKTNDLPWPPKNNLILYKKYYPDDLLKELDNKYTVKSILIESSPRLKDNLVSLKIANDNNSILGYIANIDISKNHFCESVNEFLVNSKFKGIRLRPSKINLKNNIELLNFEFLQEKNINIDLLCNPEDFLIIEFLAKNFPKLNFIINHLLNFTIDNLFNKDQLKSLKKLSKHNNIFIKVSSLPILLKSSKDLKKAYYNILYELINIFKVDNLVYGSNWPVIKTNSGYIQQFELLLNTYEKIDRKNSNKIFYNNAVELYSLQG